MKISLNLKLKSNITRVSFGQIYHRSSSGDEILLFSHIELLSIRI